jgi:hypothetical protein
VVVTELIAEILLILRINVLIRLFVQSSSESKLFSSLDVPAEGGDVLHVANVSLVNAGLSHTSHGSNGK